MNVRESVNLLMRRIEDEVVHRRAQMTAPISIITSRVVTSTSDGAAALPGAEFAMAPPDPVHLNLPVCDRSSPKVPFRLETDTSYHLNDFLPYDDAEFVNAAYQAILKREVDEDGTQTYLRMLRDGASKAEILGRLRDSPEGRQRGARVDGLSLSYVLDAISRWPVIGKFVGIVISVWNLPNSQRNQRRISNDFTFRLAQTDQRIAEVTRSVYVALETLEQSHNILSELTRSFASRSTLEGVRHSVSRTTDALRELQFTLPKKVDREQLDHELRALRAQIETKAAVTSVALVREQVQYVVQSKADRKELEQLAAEIGAAASTLANAKANSDDVAEIRTISSKIAESISLLENSKATSEDVQAVYRILNERMDQIAAVKADQGALQMVREESNASLMAGMDLIRGIAQSKADQDSVDTLKRESMGAIELARVQMLRALESKPERQEITTLSNHLLSLLQQRPTTTALMNEIAVVKADQGALHVAREESNASLAAAIELVRGIAQSKADQDGVDKLKREAMAAIEQARTQWSERVGQIAAGKADQSALQAMREEGSASLTAGLDLIRGITQSKADQDSVDTLKREMGAIEQARIQILRALESKSERQETAALSDQFIALLQQQPTKEEVKGIAAALAKADSVIANVTKTKADSGDLAVLRNEIEKETRVAIDGMNCAIRALISAKADQSTVSGLHDKMNGALEELMRNAEAMRRQTLDETKNAIELLNRGKTDQATTDAIRVEAKAAIESMSVRVSDTFAPVNSRIKDLRRNMLDQERRLGLLLEEARKRFPKPISRAQIGAMLTEEDHQLDAMYASFEDEFRGTRTDIRQRQSIYLPRIREANAGTSDAPVVDLGCGRGEWLELLGSEGLSAKGVDRNRIFLAGCRELNLDVHEQDALTFLRQCKPNSIGAVTSFHMIEHVPNGILISLIDETLRVLRPGGIVIFETPNPRNLIVSSCNFYLDPTHLHPLPPELSRFLLEARGFCNVNILEMHPFEADFQITEGAATIKDTLNKYLFSAQDYAVIGRKAA